MGARAGMSWRPRAACTSIVSVLRRICLPHMSQQGEVCLKQTVDMDDEDGRCLLDVICDPQALNDFLHGSETHVHVPQVQPSNQLSVSDRSGLPSSSSVDLDFLEDDDILGSAAREGVDGANHEPCDILQQSLAEANITEQSLQEAEAELDLGSFCLPGLTQVVQALPDPSLPGPGGPNAVGVHLGGQIFHSPTPTSTPTPPSAAPDMLGSVLAHPGLQLQPQVMNKAMTVQPFMQPVGLGNVTLQPLSSLQALPNGSQSGHLGIGPIQVMGQPTVMAINPSGQPILTKTMGGYQLHQASPDTGGAAAQTGLGGAVLGPGGGLLIQGGKPALGSPALNGASVSVGGVAVSVSSAVASTAGGAISTSAGLVGFGGTSLGVGTPQQALPPGQIMQNVVIQRTPMPIQPKPPHGGAVQTKLYKPQHMQPQPQQQQQLPTQQLPTANSLQGDASKGAGVPQQGQVPVSTAQSVAFLTGKPGGNVVLSTQAGPQTAQFPQALFKQQGPHALGKPLSVHLLNQFLLPQLPGGGQILAQHPGGHIITSQGPGGQIIANQILAPNQNLNLGQVLTSQGPSGTAHILSGHIQLQPGQMGHPTLFQVPVSLAQTQAQTHSVAAHPQAVIQGMPIQNSLAMLGQVEGLGPAVSLQPPLPPPPPPPPSQQQAGLVPLGGGPAMAQCQPMDSVSVVGGAVDQQPAHLAQAPPPPSLQPPPPSILTVQTTPSSSISISVPSSSSPSLSSSSSSSSSVPPVSGSLAPPVAQHSPGKLFLAPQGSGMFLSQESLQMFLQQDQKRQSESEPSPSGCVPASVIVSSGHAHSDLNSLSAETGPVQSPTHFHDHTHKAAVVHQIPSTGHQQQLKIQSASPSQLVPAADSPQPSQASSLILGQPVHSPQPQTQSQPPAPAPSRSCTPSSLPPLFIIHNQIGGSPQPVPPLQAPQTQQPQIQTQIPPQPRPPSQPAPFQQDVGVVSVGPAHSPKPPAALPVQFQFAPSGGTVVHSLTLEQQQTLQMVGAKLQTLSAIEQPSAQQKQLLEKLHQVQQNIILQAKQQTAAQPASSNQFSAPQDPPTTQPIASSTCATTPAQLASLLQQTSVLVKTPSTGSSEVKLFSGASGPVVATAKQGVTPNALAQPVQVNSVGSVTVGTAALQIKVLGSGLTQLTTPQPVSAFQTQTTALKMPFPMEHSKEAKTLEQLRKQQGSVLRPDYSTPFRSFEDGVQRLLPYHLYQGTLSTPQDFHRVDEEFQSVSNQLLKRTQAMLDKYRLLLFEESKRLGPSAEMVMIDRMFIQEEKLALNQDRVLAKERPEEYVANSCSLESVAVNLQHPLPVEPGTAKAQSLAVGGGATVGPSPALATPHFTPTKLVIKQAGGGASVSWSTSITPGGAALATEPARQSSSSNRSAPSDDDALPQRSSKPPMKTYEARRRIGLKLKIKQEAGLTKVVHNTALDPVHTQIPRQNPVQPSTATPQQDQQQPAAAVPPATLVIRTPPLDSAHPVPASSSSATPPIAIATTPPPVPTASATSSPLSSSSASSSAQVNGTLEHHRHTPTRNPSRPPPIPTCRLPLRKTYRENVSPPKGRDPASPPRERTVIASVKLEKRGGGKGRSQARTDHGPGAGPDPGGGGAGDAQREGGSSPGLMKDLAEVEEVLYRGMMKNTHRRHHRQHAEPGEGHGGVAGDGGGPRSKRSSGKSRETRGGERSSRRDGPASPGASPRPWDPSLPTKRRKSDSPDMDNASFSSGSPPPDHSLSEHLQSAIDSILNLQQGAPSRGGREGRTPGPHPSQQPSAHRPGAPSTSSHRLPASSSSSSSSSLSQRSQLGGAGGRGHNGSFVSRTYSR
ncbi:BRD4-interacting chromatin-remodeling complex-associated protein isoform X2 [Conger conger]|uniref:BRD4-interacting chromatin-remodeling complex-associated protein isoform X2 n=1 Tax=Conger conger TaxID=82655 RepID=UPI002A5A6716|nr:BRD4-interacting chromatin-remodeling complex-associated protein isoform X2 [Conger conger]